MKKYMDSFNQLLNQYIQRLGISDAELARAIGVSRQTIFRWREGATARPRHREDVLAIAKKLRLTPEERDTLLLAAGFRPETAEQAVIEEAEAQSNQEAEENPFDVAQEDGPGRAILGEVEALSLQKVGGIKQSEATEIDLQDRNDSEIVTVSTPSHPLAQRQRAAVVAVVGVLLLVGVGIWWVGSSLKDDANNLPTPTGTSSSNLPPSTKSTPVPAKTGETLVVVTHFANYASSQVGYNVAGRLTEALQREVDHTHLKNIRVAIWPEVVGERDLALKTGQTISATLVVYGEYDVGRVVVKMAHPANQNFFIDPAVQRYVADLQDLSATINSDLPQQMRSLALLALGQIYLRQGDTDQARLLLAQARNNLQDDSTVDEKTWGLVNFYLGIAYQHSNPPDLDGAIDAYSEAIGAWPLMVSSRLNRGAAYEARKQSGDLQQALKDAEAVVTIAPDWAPGYNNRASIRLNIGGAKNLELALIDLEKTLTLNPDLPEAYINQAFIFLRQGHPMDEIAPVLEKALELRPGYGIAFNSLCWGYATEQQPEVAMPYCEQAAQTEPAKATFKDSRGLAYALLGDYPAAIADFKAYIDWLETEQPGNTWEEELALRQEWVNLLEEGENPFTPEVLVKLREDFGE